MAYLNISFDAYKWYMYSVYTLFMLLEFRLSQLNYPKNSKLLYNLKLLNMNQLKWNPTLEK